MVDTTTNLPKNNQKNNKSIYVVIKNREGVLFEGEAKALTSINEKGIFDVLPLHENFISVIKDFIRILKLNGQEEFKITQGVLRASENRVNIYVGFGAKA